MRVVNIVGAGATEQIVEILNEHRQAKGLTPA